MSRTTVARLTTPLAALDRPANAVTDGMNAVVPWLWWPLAVPVRDRPLPTGAHVLYAVHGVVLDRVARRAGLRLRPPVATALAVLGWLVFTGAWDRRAARLRGGAVR